MVSSIFQGGCSCENCPHLRLNTYNVEIAALFAPKPLLLVACTGDWTRYNPQVAYKDIQHVYGLFNSTEKISCEQFDYGHNYNKDSREAMYRWMGKWLGKKTNWEHIKETPFTVPELKHLESIKPGKLPRNALTVAEFEAFLIKKEQQFLEEIQPRQRSDYIKFKDVMGYNLAKALDIKRHQIAPVVKKLLRNRGQGTSFKENYTADIFAFGHQNDVDLIPAILYTPKEKKSDQKKVVLLVSDAGKHTFFDFEKNQPNELIQQLLSAGITVFCIDPYGTGEFALVPHVSEREKQVANFTTFNPPDISLKVQDLITGLVYLKQHGFEDIRLVGVAQAGLWCLLAGGIVPEKINQLICDLNQFDNTSDIAYLEKLNISGIRKAGDISTAAALFAPRQLILENTGSKFDTNRITNIYQLLNAPDNCKIQKHKLASTDLINLLFE